MLIVKLHNKKGDLDALTAFLKEQDKEFPIPISQKTDIGSYAKKLLQFGYVLAAKDDKEAIQGVVAGYANNKTTYEAYESVFVINEAYRGTGLAKSLFLEQKNVCVAAGMKKLVLQTHKTNEKAIAFYRKFKGALITDVGNFYQHEWILTSITQ